MFEMPKPERPLNEARDVRIKRLAMRSMRRGIKEMDLILSAYATDRLDMMSDAGLELYDDLLTRMITICISGSRSNSRRTPSMRR